MKKFLITLAQSTFLFVGAAGISTMCSGWFHEIEIPKELKAKD